MREEAAAEVERHALHVADRAHPAGLGGLRGAPGGGSEGLRGAPAAPGRGGGKGRREGGKGRCWRRAGKLRETRGGGLAEAVL